jgi:hypothetical protein
MFHPTTLLCSLVCSLEDYRCNQWATVNGLEGGIPSGKKSKMSATRHSKWVMIITVVRHGWLQT